MKIQEGQKYGRLTALRLYSRDSAGRGIWLFDCECGNKKEARADHVTSGRIHSCGCLQRESASERRLSHGMSGNSNELYAVWINLRQRCSNPENPSYPRYGGRGIKVCERWNDFTLFKSDMGLRPTPEHTIERKDNDKDYEPDNCRWATRLEQAANRGGMFA